MKNFDIDWREAYPVLEAWCRLDRSARVALLRRVKPSAQMKPNLLGDALSPLVAGGFVRVSASGKSWLLPERRPWVRAVRAMERCRVLDEPSAVTIESYLRENFTACEVDELAPVRGHTGEQRRSLARAVLGPGWLDQVMREVEVSLDCLGEPTRDLGWRRLAGLLEELEEGPRSLLELFARRGVSEQERAELAAALHLGLGRLLLFVALDPETLEPSVGRLDGRERPLADVLRFEEKPVEPVATCHALLQLEDWTAVLIGCSANPPRLLADGRGLFRRAQRELAAPLPRLPTWLEDAWNLRPEERVDRVTRELVHADLLEPLGRYAKDSRLQITAAGRAWLQRPPVERLTALIDSFQRREEGRSLAFDGYFHEDEHSETFPALPLVPLVSLWYLSCDDVPYLAETRLFAQLAELPVGVHVPLSALAEAEPPGGNPYRLSGEDRRYFRAFGGDANPEETWSAVLIGFVARRLFPLGGVEIGHLPNGVLTMALTEVGRYVIGARPDLVLERADESAEVVVQPNFEVVFLAPSPGVEAEIGRFAQRRDPRPEGGVGVLFELTRESVQGAIGAGMSSSEITETLGRVTSKRLPGNVERQVMDWATQVRWAEQRVALLLECTDAETAALLASTGKGMRQISETIVEVVGKKKLDASLRQRLRKAGVHVRDEEELSG